mgnify:CR=1 FL=1
MGKECQSLPRARIKMAVVSSLLLVGSLASAQSTQPGVAIDLEVYNPIDGSWRTDRKDLDVNYMLVAAKG